VTAFGRRTIPGLSFAFAKMGLKNQNPQNIPVALNGPPRGLFPRSIYARTPDILGHPKRGQTSLFALQADSED